MKIETLRRTMLLMLALGGLAACDPAEIREAILEHRPGTDPGPAPPAPPPGVACECGNARPDVACANGGDRWACELSDPAYGSPTCTWQLHCDDQPSPPPRPTSCDVPDEARCVATPGCSWARIGAACTPQGCPPAGRCVANGDSGGEPVVGGGVSSVGAGPR
jgi:hypothetical protein